ncbi:serine hydrolase FSH [Rhypophila decipiens]|uniref:Serine hydrolase FSH n=1 Tax=Rhypophila decipiens TaxID=261697 RepID=A0AAN6Y045_9PEZI|nr:serine hydrolase FSH [Rhypophila decipiens]
MTTRILCLHGLGSNSAILESQLQPFRSQLPPSWEFEFLDGETTSRPFLDVGKTFPGPYLCYYDAPTPEKVQAAVDLVMDAVEEDGPFDAVLGFSYGASLAVTVIAAAAEKSPNKLPPFKSAILFNSITPYRLGSGPLHITHDLSIPGKGAVVSAYRDDYTAAQNEKYDIWNDPEADSTVQEMKMRQTEPRGTITDKGTTALLLGYYAPIHGIRVRVPTLHVHGENDAFYTQSKRVVDLCDPAPGRKVISHSGGHHFPKDTATMAKVVNAIEWVVERGAHA